jgi:hypothetical protein
MKHLVLLFSVIVVGVLMFAQASQIEQQPTVTPQQGQSAAQQKQDLAECYQIAKAKTGIDPRDLAAIAPGTLDSIPGTQSSGNVETSTPSAAPQKGASGANKKAFDKFQLANEGCMQARGYIVKSPAPNAPSPKQQ